MTVLDMVYNPVRTPLLASARRRGALAIPGMEMFLRQGIEALKLWTGKDVPLRYLRNVILDSQNRGNRD